MLAACSDSPPPAAPGAPTPPPVGTPPATTTTTPAGTWTGEARTVALCAAFSSLAAALYGEAGTNGGQGRYGTVPGAVSTFLTAAASQHTAHAAAWNGVLVAAGDPTADGAELAVAPRWREQLAAARAPVDLLTLAVDLEGVAAATATAALGELTAPPAVLVTAGVAPVASARAVTAAFLLGRGPAAPGDPLAGALGPAVLSG